MLIIGMLIGAGAYLVYHSIPSLHSAGPMLESLCKLIQPVLLFSMLFLSFCRIEPSQMRPHRWQAWLLLIQGASFSILSLLVVWALHSSCAAAGIILKLRIPIEAAMICMICPTATACAVVTGKLGGNMAGVVTYTVIVNILVALLVPTFVPLLYPGGMSFGAAFSRIIAKVFPLLILPCILAWLVRYIFPRLHVWLTRFTDLSFYIWAVALTMAILMSTRAIVHSEGAIWSIIGIGIASLITCLIQFWSGKKIGSASGHRITAGQALGQKNTVFAIWMGYTFMDPIVSVAGGFYSIWHNIFNSRQLYRRRLELENGADPGMMEL